MMLNEIASRNYHHSVFISNILNKYNKWEFTRQKGLPYTLHAFYIPCNRQGRL